MGSPDVFPTFAESDMLRASVKVPVAVAGKIIEEGLS